MASYKVLKQGFYDSKLYDPRGKRRILHRDTPFKKCPTWLEPLKAETAAQKKKREAAEMKVAKAAEMKAAADIQDIADASFMGEGEIASSSTVETL